MPDIPDPESLLPGRPDDALGKGPPKAEPKPEPGKRLVKRKSARDAAKAASENRDRDVAQTKEKAKTVGPAFEVLTPGEKFGEFQVLKCLAFDLIGTLYSVRKARDREERALLVLPPALSDRPDTRSRLSAMMPKLRELDHPDILSPQMQLEIKNRHVMLCKGVNGVALGDFFETEAIESKDGATFGLPQDMVKRMIDRILRALDAAHSKGIFHHNLNPSNILRTPNGEIILTGFGLVEVIGQKEFENIAQSSLPPLALGPAQNRIGSAEIVSPEAKSGEKLDQRADIYAVGVLTYWMLTGSKPERNSPSVGELLPKAYSGWDVLIQTCLEPNRKRRYSSAAEVLTDLEGLETLNEAGKNKRGKAREFGQSSSGGGFLGFIPVPAIFEENAAAAIVFRLGISGGLAACCLALVFLLGSLLGGPDPTVIDEKPAAPVVQQATGDLPHNLAIRISPAQSTLKLLDDPSFQMSVRDGVAKLAIAPEAEGMLLVEAVGFTSKKVDLARRGTFETPASLSLKLDPAPVPIEFRTEPNALVAGIASPGGDPFPVAIANGRGIARSEFLLPGNYTFVVGKRGFRREAFSNIELPPGASGLAFDMPIEAIPGVIRVRTEPAGASVYINGQLEGQTNLTIDNLPTDESLTIAVDRPGFVPLQETVSLEPETKTVLDFGPLELQTFELVPEVTVDGKPATPALLSSLELVIRSDNPASREPILVRNLVDPGSIETLSAIPAGTINLLIRHEHFDEFTKEFEAPHRARVRLAASLKSKPAELNLNIFPDGVAVSLIVDGGFPKPLGTTRKILVPTTKTSPYVLEFRATDFMPVSRQLVAMPGASVTWDIELQRLPGPEAGRDYLLKIIDHNMAWAPPGRFKMGSPIREPGRDSTENELTQVTLSRGFWIGTTEITQEMYAQISRQSPSDFNGSNLPVDSVSWLDAMEFCKRLNEREAAAERIPDGYEIRLPTEAEWEYAARAGSDDPFQWGSTASSRDGNFKGVYPEDTDIPFEPSRDYGTKPVGSYEPNVWGLYDVHGNVAEWCLDYHRSRLPGGSEIDLIRTRTRDFERVVRGGSWQDEAKDSRAAYREFGYRPTVRQNKIGFRIVIAPIVSEDLVDRSR